MTTYWKHSIKQNHKSVSEIDSKRRWSCIFSTITLTVFQDPEVDSKGQVAFKSNLFGSLGAGMFVAPNMIDFGTIFQNVDQKILANLAVFVVVILLVVLYVPGVVICRKQDKLDLIKVGISPILSLNDSTVE